MSPVPDPILVKSKPDRLSEPKTRNVDGLQSWQRDLAGAVRTAQELLTRLNLTAEDMERTDFAQAERQAGQTLSQSERQTGQISRLAAYDRQAAVQQGPVPDFPVLDFPVLVPDSFLKRMQPANPQDPLLLQVWPSSAEQIQAPGFVADAVGDLAARRAPGMIHKYHGRALLVAAGACAVHCLYCFRREYPYDHDPRTLEEWRPALQEIAADASISEVILSGGDPLMLNDVRLHTLCSQLDQIPHIERIRLHSRMPIVLPSRVTTELLNLPRRMRSQMIMVVHANHPQEIAADCQLALQKMVKNGIPVLNQAVLLRNINDDADVLEELCRRLINVGVIPYYLHQLDRVVGVSHFEVPHDTGRNLIEQLTARLPGYAVPKYVQEFPGQSSKTAL